MKHERVCVLLRHLGRCLTVLLAFFFYLSPAIVIFDRGEVKLKDISNGKKKREKKKGEINYERHTDKKGTKDRRSMTQAKQVTTSHNRKISYPLPRK